MKKQVKIARRNLREINRMAFNILSFDGLSNFFWMLKRWRGISNRRGFFRDVVIDTYKRSI